MTWGREVPFPAYPDFADFSVDMGLDFETFHFKDFLIGPLGGPRLGRGKCCQTVKIRPQPFMQLSGSYVPLCCCHALRLLRDTQIDRKLQETALDALQTLLISLSQQGVF